MPQLFIGNTVPNFSFQTQLGEMDLYDYLGSGWGIIFSHPADFTPVCTTELGEVARLADEFLDRNTRVIGLSCNDVGSHQLWIADIKAATGQQVEFPVISDESRAVSCLLGMISEEMRDNPENKNKMLAAVRSVLIISPDRKLQLTLTYPPSTGRNFHEILRVLDSLQMTKKHFVATPVNWTHGQDVVVMPSVTDEDADEIFPSVQKIDLPSGKGYLRMTADPTASED